MNLFLCTRDNRKCYDVVVPSGDDVEDDRFAVAVYKQADPDEMPKLLVEKVIIYFTYI